MEPLNQSLKKNTWAIILSGIIVSFIFPDFGIFLKPYLNYLLGFILFLSCLDLNVKEIISTLADYKAQLMVLVITHLVPPLIVFFLKDYFSPEIFLGLIIATTIPAGRSAVFLSNLYGGNPTKALTVTSISNLLSPITVPALVWLFANTTIKINTQQMGTTIFFLVVIPVILAFIVGQTRPGRSLNRLTTPLSTISLFFIILGIISPIKNIITANFQLSLILLVVVSIFIIISFFLGTTLKPNLSDKITYGLSSSYKNYTLGTLLSLTLFSPLVALPSVAYTIANNLLLIPLQIILNRQPTAIHPRHRRRRRQNYFLFIIGILLAVLITRSPISAALTPLIDHFPIIAAIIAGLFFSSTFTVAIGGLLIIQLSSIMSPVLLVLLAGFGAVSTDCFMFLFVKKNISQEISPIYEQVNHRSHLLKILHTRYFAWTLPVLGAIIIASPLPDELAISLLGLSSTSNWHFILISLTSHLIGIGSLVAGSRWL